MEIINENNPLTKSNSEGISTQVSYEANRLAALRIGSDIPLVNPFTKENMRTEAKPPVQMPKVDKDKEANQPQNVQQRPSSASGWQGYDIPLRGDSGYWGRRGPPRVDLQRCDGNNIVSWLRMVDLHISNQQYSDKEWMAEVPYYLQGGALALWWEVHERNVGENTLSWASFKQELMDRFCPRSEMEVISNLRQVKYKDDIRTYIQQFSETVMQGRRPAEDVLVQRFLFGLPPDYFMILNEGGVKSYATLSEVMSRAKQIFAPKEAAAAEYIERNSDRANQINRYTSDPVFLRILNKLGLNTNRNEKSNNERFQERDRKDNVSPPQQQQTPRYFGRQQGQDRPQNQFKDRNVNTFTNNNNFEQRRIEVAKIHCRLCGGKGHEEVKCTLREESNRRPGQTCIRCGGKDHFIRECSSPRWFRVYNSRPQVNCVVAGNACDNELQQGNDAA